MAEPKKKRWPYVVGGVLALLILIVAGALWRLDAILLSRARTEAAQLSQQLGRPVEIGGISTKLFPNVGAQVTGVSIGAAQGEPVPLAQLQAVDVRVALMPLLKSRGEDIQVLNAEASGLTLNVVRLADGTTNVQRLQEKLAEQKKPEEAQPPKEEKPTDLSAVRVDRAALTDGVIRFIDESGAKAQQLSIQDLDIEVKDLRAGKPLDVTLAAAVFAQQQNLHATLHTAPLPPTLVPTPERLTLKADKIDLSPLGPFLPGVGLRAGTLDADWKAELGNVVPGGQGPTHFEGTVHALGLRFAEAEGGKALDAVLDTNVTADVGAGNLALDKLDMKLGPATVNGHGRVQGLMSETPKVEGFELVGRNLDPEALAAYYPPLRKQLAGRIAGPLGFVVRGSGTQAAQALDIDVDLTPVRLRIPQQLSKEAGTPMRLTSRVTGAAASGGALRFDAKADLDGVDMRPGLLLNKAPGQRFDVAAAGTYQPARGKAPMKVDLGQLTVALLDNTMAGTASFALGTEGKQPTTTYALNLKSPKLNADALLLNDEQVATQNDGKPPPAPPVDPNRFNGYRGDMRMEIGALRYKDMDLSNVVTQVKQVDDLITVERFSTGLYGGKVVADGTSVRLGPAPEQRPFEAKVKVEGLNMKQALAAHTPKQVMDGTFNGNVDVKGVGYTPDQLQKTLLGAINGNVANGTFYGLDIVSKLSEPLAKALPFASKAIKDERVTSLGDSLPFGVKIQNGVAQLERPISWTRPEAAMSFDGGIRLDGTLDLKGTVSLTPATIKTLTAGKVVPTAPIPLTLALTGKAWSPQVTGLDVKPAATAIAKQAASGLAGQLLGEKGKPLQDIIQGGPDAARQQADQRMAEERKKAEDAARAEQQRQQQKLQEEAQKKLRGLFGGK